MKKFILAKLLTFFSFIFLFSQNGSVGINTENPQATLEVVGNPADPSKLDGIILPKITGNELSAKNYTSKQIGTIIYVTEVPSTLEGQVKFITSNGFYSFDGNFWQSLKSSTLYESVNAGNYASKYISFTGDSSSKQGTIEGAFGYNPTTKSFFLGGLNPSHTGNYNVTSGLNSGAKITTGYSNTISGTNAGANITIAYENSFFGKDAANLLTKGMWNAGLGEASFFNVTESLLSTAIGDASLGNITGRIVFNTAIGSNALRYGSANMNGNIGIGADAGKSSVGNNNIFLGNGAGRNTTATNKLIIHNNRLLDDGSNGGAGKFAELVGTNALIYGDFVDRWLRINGSLIVSPSYIKTADSSFDKILSYNNTTGEIGISTASNFGFIPLNGTVSGAPITGDLVVENGNAQGGFSIKTLTENAYLKFLDDGTVELNKNSGSNVNIQGIDFAGISNVWSSGITGQYYYGANYKINSYVQKKYVDDKIAALVTVPAPPATGNYVLKSVNGVMSWVSE